MFHVVLATAGRLTLLPTLPELRDGVRLVDRVRLRDLADAFGTSPRSVLRDASLPSEPDPVLHRLALELRA